MDRNPLYRMPMSPAAVVQKIAEQKNIANRAVADKSANVYSIADRAAANNRYSVTDRADVNNVYSVTDRADANNVYSVTDRADANNRYSIPARSEANNRYSIPARSDANNRYSIPARAENKSTADYSVTRKTVDNMSAAGNQNQQSATINNSSATNSGIEKVAQVKYNMNTSTRYGAATPQEPEITQQRLQDAIVWSEILGKPVSKRGKRRRSWQ